MDNNIIYGNYIPFIHEKGSKEELFHRYYSSHKKCPKCGGTNISQTLMGFVMDANNYDAFKDENKCNCKCGWTGIVHDLI